MNILSCVLRGLAVLLLAACSLRAQTTVNVDTAARLADAISTANTSSTTTTIVLAAGTYNLTADLPALAANDLTVRGPATGSPAIINATALASGVIFKVVADQVTIANLSLRNARGHAISIQAGADSGRVQECAFSYPTAPIPATAAIDGVNCQNWTITGNSITGLVGASATAEPAIHFYGGAAGTTATDNLILNCDRAIGFGGDPTALAPAITRQPASTIVTAGQTATFTVEAVGTPAPTFQWYKNGAALAGATSASYTTPATTIADNSATFTVTLANSAGTVTTTAATLTVKAAIAITSQPASLSVLVGQTATFTVVATSDVALSYQWYKNDTLIPGARYSSFTTAATGLADSGATYRVVITDAYGATLGSASATLTVTAATRRTQHYVDPVNGSDTGDGSSSSPWKNLQTVINTKVETQTWEGTLPYTAGKALVPVNAGAPVRAGDIIWLRTGDHGALTIQSAYNAAPVTIAAEAGATPRFTSVLVQSSQNWILRGWSVSPSFATTYSNGTIVNIQDHNFRGPAYDIVIDGFQIFSIPDESVWTLASDWNTKAANGITAFASRVVIRNCLIKNTNFGLAVTGRGCRAEHNTIDTFSGDGMRGLGDDCAFEYNTVKNLRLVNGNHPDGFQSWSLGSDGSVGTGVVKNVTLRGNTFIAYENLNSPFASSFQGIGCFDGYYQGWIVENNVIISNTYHGIALYGARECRIVNNTLVDPNTTDTVGIWILVTDHENGTPSTHCVIRNNLTPVLSNANDTAHDIVVDHNLILPKDTTGYFVNLAQFNVRPAPGAKTIDQGLPNLAPALDADEKPRPQGANTDVGAYEYTP